MSVSTPHGYLRAHHILLLHLRQECLHIVTHEIEFMLAVVFRRMEGDLGWRETKYQPTASNVDIGKSNYVS